MKKSIVLSPTQGNINTYADSTATSHLFCSIAVFVPISLHVVFGRTLMLADYTSLTATKRSDVILPFLIASLRLTDAFFVLDLTYNLVSVGRLADKRIEFFFHESEVCLTHRYGFLI